jgi:hypothetical protein
VYKISAGGLDTLSVADADTVRVAATETRGYPLRLRVAHGAGHTGSNKINISLTAVDDPSLHVQESAVFIVPR